MIDSRRSTVQSTRRSDESTRRSESPGFSRITRPTTQVDKSKLPATREPQDLYTFGYGGQGALGNGAFRDEISPYLVSSLRAHGGVLLLSCGFDHTVAVTGDLRARAWGRAQEGQLGIHPGESEDVLESPRGGSCVLMPTLTGICEGETPALVQAVSGGGMHTLMMTLPQSSRDEPVVFAVGRGCEGQLGAGPQSLAHALHAAAQIDLPTELPPALISAGGLHSAALSSHGHVFMWGDGGCGQLGLPPRRIPRAAPPARGSHTVVAAGPGDMAATGAVEMEAIPPIAVSVPHLLPSMSFEGRADLERPERITVSAEEEGGRTFVVRGRRHPLLQASTNAYMHIAPHAAAAAAVAPCPVPFTSLPHRCTCRCHQ